MVGIMFCVSCMVPYHRYIPTCNRQYPGTIPCILYGWNIWTSLF